MNAVTPFPTQAVDTRYTQDVIPILDTSKFEHMQRLATVMAKMSILPESLRTVKDGNATSDLPHEVVVANCFRIVNQAVRWGMDPFALMDCASIIHGKLMWEGKVIAAVLDAKLGVQLEYEFNGASGQEFGVTVSGVLPNETKVRTIKGRVKDWHKGPKSPWANEGAWERQLRYMGAREWARAHKPAVMLGVYGDDELDGMMARDIPDGQRHVRMKDVTPKPTPPPLELPDIPDEAEPEAEHPLADQSAVLREIEAQLDSRPAAEVEREYASAIMAMDEDGRTAALEMIQAKS